MIESAFTLGLSQIDSSVAAWQRRVGVSGKLVGKFADRVRALLRSVLEAYKQRTAGTVTLRERNRRSLELRDHLKQSATNLFNQQLAILQTRAINQLREVLLALPYSPAAAEDLKEAESQALRNALFDFKAAIADLEIAEFGLQLGPAVIADLSSKFQTLAAELPETPMAKLMEMKKMDAQAKSPKKKGSRGFSLSPSLNLVGMLRPAGFGNLQGFVNYATSLAGLPLELLLGFQNDGESPDVMGDDREYPLLRLQPKIHFDVDV